MRILAVILVIFGLIAGGVVWLLRHPASPIVAKITEVSEPVPIPDPETYAVTVEEIDYHRKKLSKAYRKAKTDTERQAIIASARSLLELTMPSLMRCWLGTPWDYNGMAAKPGGGKVACGYFVSTIMRDSGFDVQRIRLAQQPSQNILLTFLPREKLHIKVDVNYPEYLDLFRRKDHGIYIIGLDKHVGFLIHDENGVQFIHSGGLLRRVVDEGPSDAYSIEKSNYRVIGNITGDKELLKRWLLEDSFPTYR
ncbi:hypothetical protein NT6N_10640 [Oceaniferula spumae]|uniref:DUF1287 domain-containing protein n=1 Tax=Oceaniferula spumae TaxID=2979115 RepID=A0AAT9FJ41_9BACT